MHLRHFVFLLQPYVSSLIVTKSSDVCYAYASFDPNAVYKVIIGHVSHEPNYIMQLYMP